MHPYDNVQVRTTAIESHGRHQIGLYDTQARPILQNGPQVSADKFEHLPVYLPEKQPIP